METKTFTSDEIIAILDDYKEASEGQKTKFLESLGIEAPFSEVEQTYTIRLKAKAKPGYEHICSGFYLGEIIRAGMDTKTMGDYVNSDIVIEVIPELHSSGAATVSWRR